LRDAGVGNGFLDMLLEKGYLTSPGEYWLSGYELFNAPGANVITFLIDSWHPLPPRSAPFDPQIRPR
jgi:hypothetical protein